MAATSTAAVVIGMDPHKRSATIEVMAADERVLGGRGFATDAPGYRAMLTYAPAVAGPGLGDRGMPGHRQTCCDPPGP